MRESLISQIEVRCKRLMGKLTLDPESIGRSGDLVVGDGNARDDLSGSNGRDKIVRI